LSPCSARGKRAFAFIGGVPAMAVSDNLRSGITKACFYEPSVNRSYADMAAHYDTAVVPARPYPAREKAKSLPRRRPGSKWWCKWRRASSSPSCATDSRSPHYTRPSPNSSRRSITACRAEPPRAGRRNPGIVQEIVPKISGFGDFTVAEDRRRVSRTGDVACGCVDAPSLTG
jgi:hypothetical protein